MSNNNTGMVVYDKSAELAKLDDRIAQLSKLRDKMASEIKSDEELAEKRNSRVTQLDNLEYFCSTVSGSVNELFKSIPDQSEETRNKKSVATMNVLSKIRDAVNEVLPDVTNKSVAAMIVVHKVESIDATSGAILSSQKSVPCVEIVEVDSADPENAHQFTQSALMRASSSLTKACEELPSKTRGLLPMSSASNGERGLLGAKKLDKEALRKKYNAVVETLLKLFPNCQLLTIDDGATVAQVIEAVLAGVKVIVKLASTLKKNKNTKKK